MIDFFFTTPLRTDREISKQITKKHEPVLCDKLCLVSYTRFHRSINTTLCDLTELCACELVMRFGLELEMKVVTRGCAYARQHTRREVGCLPQRCFHTFLVVSWCASRFRVPEAIYICILVTWLYIIDSVGGDVMVIWAGLNMEMTSYQHSDS